MTGDTWREGKVSESGVGTWDRWRWFVLAVLVSGLVAQQPEPVFRSNTRLVELSVAVTDSDGKPVSGLGREDFTVYAAGRPRPIAFLQYDGAAVVRDGLQPLPPNVFTNRAEFLPASARNVTAIVLDSLNSNMNDAYRVRGQVAQMLQTMPADSRVALYHLGARFQVLHDFTGDMASLQRKLVGLKVGRRAGAEEDRAALEAEAQQFLESLARPSSDSGSNGQDRRTQELWQEQLDRALAVERWVADRNRANRTEMAFNCMMVLADHLKSIPGRKSLIWAGGGLPLVHVLGHLAPGPHNEVRSNATWIQAASRRLAEANVVLYYYDTRGVMAPAMPAGQQQYRAMTQEEWINADATLGTSWLASNTGGRFVQGSNSIATAFERVTEDLKGSYTLAFYAPEDADAKWVPLKVQVRRRGARVMHRDGYPGNDAPGQPEGKGLAQTDSELIRAALRNPLGSSSVLMNARCQPASGELPGTLQLLLQMDAESVSLQQESGSRKGALDVIVADVTPDGRVFTHEHAVNLTVSDEDWQQTLRQGILYQRIWKPHTEATRVRVLVRDRATGHHGTLDVPLAEVAAR
jgi:VWFA-related protein